MRGEAKNITKGNDARIKLLNGASTVYEAVAATYGATSGNVAIQKNYGGAVITKDGVSVAREIFLKDPVEDTAAGLLIEASEKSNSVSGDGTSATVLLGYHIYEKAHQRVAAGYNPMGLRRGIEKASRYIKDEVTKVTSTVADDDLVKVASISATDPEIGKLVADTVLKVGGIGITVEGYEGLGVIQDVVDGLYFEKGWTMPHFVTDRSTEEAVHENLSIILLEKHIKQNQDIAPILNTVFKNTDHKTALIIGNIDGQALETCALTNLQGGVKLCVVKPPVYGDQELPFLEDVAAMTGAKVIPSSLPADKVTIDMLGKAGKVIVTKDTTTLFDGGGSSEAVKSRIADIKEQLQSDKYSAFQKERMEMRLAKLQGKIGIIRVGGATETEQKEVKFRVEDAIHATRAAKEDGVVPGGATTLARISQTVPNIAISSRDEREGFNLVMESLVEPFKQLMINAGEDGGYKLGKLLESDHGKGFNVLNITIDPIDLAAEGILDPSRVIKSVVENACSFAGVAITIPMVISIDREYQLQQINLNKAQMQ